MLDFLATSLKSRYQVHTANNGTEAMSVLRESRVDLVLSDMQMPGRGGMELLADIRTHLDYQPLIVMMTAFGTIELALEATRRGAQDFLTKPFGMDQLDHAINRAFEFASLQTENKSLRTNAAVRSAGSDSSGSTSGGTEDPAPITIAEPRCSGVKIKRSPRMSVFTLFFHSFFAEVAMAPATMANCIPAEMNAMSNSVPL